MLRRFCGRRVHTTEQPRLARWSWVLPTTIAGGVSAYLAAAACCTGNPAAPQRGATAAASGGVPSSAPSLARPLSQPPPPAAAPAPELRRLAVPPPLPARESPPQQHRAPLQPAAPPTQAGKMFSGVCASVRSDGRWLIDDGSTDDSRSIATAFARSTGALTLIPGGVPPHDPRTWYPPHGIFGVRDAAAHARCWDHAGHRVKWMALLDSDEFAFPRFGCSMREALGQCAQNSTHVLLRWEMFGGQGFDRHPAGLLTENFLTSGGNCSQYGRRMRPPRGVERRRSARSCANPFDYCGHGGWTECRHTKYIANTDCLRGPRHAMAHQPARLDEAPQECDAKADSVEQCTRWLREGGCGGEHPGRCTASHAPKRCCSAGIGLHHYAAKSSEARSWRRARGQRDPSPPLAQRDLNWVVSPAALRFLARIRARMPRGGASPAVSLVSGDRGGRCHLARGIAQSGAELRNFSAATPSECCGACAATAGCGGFAHVAHAALCRLYAIDGIASRAPTDDPGAAAGILLQGECPP
eukprot:TRINITY_DN36602_c0_g1_i2.p1 TRINITY_DN36602_c0_g1~~TRINITY_DN36602_c0_g1_i2.p1  ORF type:complete len:527 (+),score=64.57 TRINITY_DN36602_c0_g1_i2:95-1675(+)